MIQTSRLSFLVLILAVLVISPALADTYYAYTQAGIPPGANLWTWCEGGICDVGTDVACETPEGGASLHATGYPWIGWGVFPSPAVDLTDFENGELRFFVKGPMKQIDGTAVTGDVKVEIQCQGAGTPVTQYLADNGWEASNFDSWQEITIPICDFFAGGVCDTTCLASISSPFLTTAENLGAAATFSIDYARWVTPNSHTGGSSVQVQGRQLLVDGEPFAVNGMAYSPVPQCEGWPYGWYDRYDRYSVDFPLIAASGANTVRLYAPIVSTAMMDEAWANGLYVIPTFGVDPNQLSCAVGRDFMQDRFLEMVEEWGDHPALLLWLIGNEINGGLTPTERCDTWYPQLDALAAAAHAAEGTSFHPVGTANSVASIDLPDVCQAACSDDTTLPNVDYWAVQLYRGCTFQTAFDEYAAKPDCARPLIVTEFGVDAWDMDTDANTDGGFEDEIMQADCLESLLDHAGQALAVRTPGGVSSGQVIFEWADEWWKGECTGSEWCNHDTCELYVNVHYSPAADTSMNEEWWGIATLNETDPALRGLRAAYDRVGDAWLGSACNLLVDAHDPATGSTAVSFDPAVGNVTNHALYYGPLSSVSSYAYSGSVPGLDITGSSTLTLPSGSLFYVVVAENGNLQEGCYGLDSAGAERPCFPNPSACAMDQTSGFNCLCGAQ